MDTPAAYLLFDEFLLLVQQLVHVELGIQQLQSPIVTHAHHYRQALESRFIQYPAADRCDLRVLVAKGLGRPKGDDLVDLVQIAIEFGHRRHLERGYVHVALCVTRHTL